MADQSEDLMMPMMEVWQPEGHILPTRMRPVADQLVNLRVRDKDVWVITFPKCGTTWSQELVWLLTHRLDYETATSIMSNQRSVFIEYSLIPSGARLHGASFEKTLDSMEKLESPRVIKSHLFWSRIPKDLRRPDSQAKIVYITRDPRDACISCYHFYRMLEPREIFEKVTDTFDNFCERFITDKLVCCPYWSHVLDFWKYRNQDNVMFFTYEEMKENLSKVIKKLADFLEVPQPTPEEMPKLLEYLSFDKMKNNPDVNKKGSKNFHPIVNDGKLQDPEFMRKGQVGEWKQAMSDKWKKRFDAWVKKNTEGTDFPFYRSIH